MKRTRIVATLVVVVGIILSGCSAAFSSSILGLAPAALSAIQSPDNSDPGQVVGAELGAPQQQAQSLTDFQSDLIQVYQDVNPSVVNIEVEVNAASGAVYSDYSQSGLGSGFVWDKQGRIVTNNHVVEDASRIVVTFSDGTTVEAELVGADPNSDLAVIQVDVPADQLVPVTMMDSDQIQVGQVAIAIGNPYGLSGTMTQGIVSALSRSLPVSSTEDGSSYTIPDIIQTDAAINPGNSGGVLVNTDGDVMGVTAAIRSSSDSNSGIGFVIPANIVVRVAPELIDEGEYAHTYMGISGMTLTMDLASAMDLDSDLKGVVVIEVAQGSPAEKAGLVRSTVRRSNAGEAIPTGGDVITAIDGQTVKTFEDLTSYLFANTQVGQTVTLTVLRQGREQAVKLTLGAIPSSALR